jgi:Bacterial regulatory protein, Fis family
MHGLRRQGVGSGTTSPQQWGFVVGLTPRHPHFRDRANSHTRWRGIPLQANRGSHRRTGELSHVMERVTLLHVGEAVGAKTLTQLCPPVMAPTVTPKITQAPQEVAGEHSVAADAEEIRQALVRTGGNVARAARLLGVSRDTVCYRMQCYGITQPRPEPPSPRMPLLAHEVGFSASPTPTLAHARQEREQPSPGGTAPRDDEHGVMIDPKTPPAAPAWEHNPVAVLALELTWPAIPGFESLRYDPKGDLPRALPLLERAVSLCHDANLAT